MLIVKPPFQEESKKLKKEAKKRKEELGLEEEEDIDAILADFKREQEAQFLVTEEADCAPPTRRAGASLSVNPLNPTELLLFGGEYYDGQKVHMYNELYRFNTEKRTWSKITSPNSPGPRSSHQVAITPAGRLFLWGGEFVSPNQTGFFHYKDFWTCDLAAKEFTWEQLDIKGRPPPRSGHRMVQWKHLFVMFGGFFDNYTETRYYDDLWVFDTLNFVWVKLDLPEPRPTARSGFQMFAHGDLVCVYGGYCKTVVKGKKSVGRVHSDMWVLRMSSQLDAIRWERRKKAGGLGPTLRSGCTMTVHKGRAIMFGGVSDVQESDETLESVYHKDMFQFNIDSNKWFPLTLRMAKKPKNKNKKKQKKKTKKKKAATAAASSAGGKGKGKGKRRGDSSNSDSDSGSDSPSDASDDDSDASESESESEPEPEAPHPCERFSTMLTVSKNTLYLWVSADARGCDAFLKVPLVVYGGLIEDKKKEITLNDMWALNLDKLNEWVPILEDNAFTSQWLGEESDDDENDDDDDDDEGGEDEEDDEDDDDDDDDDDDEVEEDGDAGEGGAGPSGVAQDESVNKDDDEDEEEQDTKKRGKSGKKQKPAKKRQDSKKTRNDGEPDNDGAAAWAGSPAAQPRPGKSKKSKKDKHAADSPAADAEAGDASGRVADVLSATSQLSLDAAATPMTDEERARLIAAEPLVHETLRDYFARTSVHWQNVALQDSSRTGKALRRVAFELAQERFDAAQPELEEMRELLRQNEAAAAATAKAAAERAAEQRTSRNRRHQTCQVPADTVKQLESLRFRKAKSNAALILKIDVPTLTVGEGVVQDEYLDNTTLEEVQENLPDSTPRFIVLSYEMRHKDGRISYPLVGLYYNPDGSSTNNRMLYASTRSYLFQKAEISGKVFDLTDAEDLTDDWMVQKLEASLTRP
nr:hypothetical protein HK105_005252 [Polyrhizophydium stewartii]